MKILTPLGILMMVFTNCAVLTPQETQQERLRRIEAYNEVRERHNPEKVKSTIKDLLIGKWQYVGLEVEEGTVSAKMKKQMPGEKANASNSFEEGGSKRPTSRQTPPADTLEQTTLPAPPNPDGDEQTLKGHTPRLSRIEVTDKKSSQQLSGAKAALVASTRQNLTLEFFEHRGSYHYKGNNRGKHVTGQCYVITKRYGDDPFPFISFNRHTGIDLIEFLFGAETVKRIAAKKKQERIERIRNLVSLSAQLNKTTSFAMAKAPGITVTKDTLYLVLYGEMKLTPKGWMRIGGLRCTFKKLE